MWRIYIIIYQTVLDAIKGYNTIREDCSNGPIRFSILFLVFEVFSRFYASIEEYYISALIWCSKHVKMYMWRKLMKNDTWFSSRAYLTVWRFRFCALQRYRMISFSLYTCCDLFIHVLYHMYCISMSIIQKGHNMWFRIIDT